MSVGEPFGRDVRIGRFHPQGQGDHRRAVRDGDLCQPGLLGDGETGRYLARAVRVAVG